MGRPLRPYPIAYSQRPATHGLTICVR